jgi:hypothetical protein
MSRKQSNELDELIREHLHAMTKSQHDQMLIAILRRKKSDRSMD